MIEPSENSPRKCLVVDDETAICQTISFALESQGWNVQACTTFEEAKNASQDSVFDLALIDLKLGNRSGLDLMPPLLRSHPGLPIVIITAYASIPSAVEAMRRGAVDYLPKPFNPQELRQAVGQAFSTGASLRRKQSLEARPQTESKVPAMQHLLDQAYRAAATDITVLLLGETGTGKGVMAKLMHDHGKRKNGPFVVVPCPSLSAELLESELFGHEKGAFTGAYRDHKGRLAQAEGGTLFLDEIGDMPLGLQTKLLRVLQTREYERLGSSETLRADVRIIAATHVDLATAVKAGRFREDLYFRLNGLELMLLPLRERIGDIEHLAQSMLAELHRQNGSGALHLSKPVSAAFKKYPWPGNLREMHNLLERASVLGNGDDIKMQDLTQVFHPAEDLSSPDDSKATLTSIEEIEVAHIRKVIAATRNLEEAAQILGIDYVTLWRRRKKYGL